MTSFKFLAKNLHLGEEKSRQRTDQYCHSRERAQNANAPTANTQKILARDIPVKSGQDLRRGSLRHEADERPLVAGQAKYSLSLEQAQKDVNVWARTAAASELKPAPNRSRLREPRGGGNYFVLNGSGSALHPRADPFAPKRYAAECLPYRSPCFSVSVCSQSTNSSRSRRTSPP